MQTDSNPFFRKSLIPWYDADPACILIFLAMLLTALFGLAGVNVARRCPDYHAHAWIPLLVVLLSAGAGISSLIRLARRHRQSNRSGPVP